MSEPPNQQLQKAATFLIWLIAIIILLCILSILVPFAYGFIKAILGG